MKLLTLVIILLGQLWITEAGRCEDQLEFEINVKSEDDHLMGTIKNCADLKEKFSSLCQNEIGQEKCCQTCKEIVRSVGKGCVDSLEVQFTIGDTVIGCKEFIEMNPCHCKNKYDLSNGKRLVVNHECCLTCSGIDTSALNCDCKDRITPDDPFTISETEHLSSCHELVTKYPELCKRARKFKCCKACEHVSDCQDTRMRTWSIHGQSTLSCPELIARDNCYCQKHREACCQSCSSVRDEDLTECCVDDPTFRINVKKTEVLALVGDHLKWDTCLRCTCEKLFYGDPSHQMMKVLCQQNLKNGRNRCCKSCSLLGFKP